MEPELSPYFARRNELTIEEDCLLRGIQVVVPPNLHKRVLELLLESHLGVVKMKALARSHVLWPGIDKALEEAIKHCEECQTNHKDTIAPIGIHIKALAKDSFKFCWSIRCG